VKCNHDIKEMDMEADDGEQDVKNKHGEQEVVLARPVRPSGGKPEAHRAVSPGLGRKPPRERPTKPSGGGRRP
jgi:hypothetical protein